MGSSKRHFPKAFDPFSGGSRESAQLCGLAGIVCSIQYTVPEE
jgi:hypothetical protein